MIQPNNIFATAPKKDYLKLFQETKPKYNRVVQFLNLKKEDVAKATAIPLASIRADDKMPKELQERLSEWAILLNLVAGHFKGDIEKTVMWFSTVNPLLGNLSPRDMLRFGRYKRLFKFVITAIAENEK